MHARDKNTGQYRVRKAEDAIGGPVHGREWDVELALRICLSCARFADP